jgi:hypothetical protein
MNPAACARAKKAARLAREEAIREVVGPERLPDAPEDPYVTYRRHTRAFRRTFRGIITRKEAESLVLEKRQVLTRTRHDMGELARAAQEEA